MFQQDPRAANSAMGGYSQMSPYRDGPEDEDQQRQNVAAAIAPQPQAPQAPQAQPQDTSAPQRAALQRGSAPQGGSAVSGSLGSMGGAAMGAFMGGGGRPQTGTVQRSGSLASMGQGGGQIAGSMLQSRMGQGGQDGGYDGSGINPQGVPKLGPDGAYTMPPRPQIQPEQGPMGPAPQAAPQARAAFNDPRLSGGWDRGKWESGHDSPKYAFGNALLGNAGFDPSQGLRDEDIAALNALGLGHVTRSGDSRDKVHIEGGDPRFNGLTDIDLIQGYGTGAGKLNFEDANGGQGMDPMAQAMGAPSEDALAQAAMLGVDTNNPMWQEILEQLQGELQGQGGQNADPRFRY